MKNMILMCYILGFGAIQMDGGIFISQKKYVCYNLMKSNIKASKRILTLVAKKMKLTKDEGGNNVNVKA